MGFNVDDVGASVRGYATPERLKKWSRWLPIFGWWPTYTRGQMTNDMMAAVIVTVTF